MIDQILMPTILIIIWALGVVIVGIWVALWMVSVEKRLNKK